MEDVSTELIIKHKNNQTSPANEPDEVNINIKDIGHDPQGSDSIKSKSINKKTKSEPELETITEVKSRPDIKPSSESETNNGILDTIQSKLNSYPLPTSDISKMTPPTPPTPEHNNQDVDT